MCMIVVLNYTVIPQFEQLYISMDVNLSFYQKFLTSMITSFFLIFFITILILIFVILTIVLLRIETSKNNYFIINTFV